VVTNNIQVGLVRIVPTLIPSQLAPVINKAINEPTFNFLHPIPIISKTVNNNGNGKSAEMTCVQMPKKWADFFKVFLSSPSNYAWAKKLLQTQFPETIYQPWDATNLTLPSEPIKHLVEQCGKLSTLDSSVVLEESPILEEEEEYNLSPQSKESQDPITGSGL